MAIVDLVQKRSTDGGKTWGPLELIHEEGGDGKSHDRQSVPGRRSRHGRDLAAV